MRDEEREMRGGGERERGRLKSENKIYFSTTTHSIFPPSPQLVNCSNFKINYNVKLLAKSLTGGNTDRRTCWHNVSIALQAHSRSERKRSDL